MGTGILTSWVATAAKNVEVEEEEQDAVNPDEDPTDLED
jgi:hypothetical protein